MENLNKEEEAKNIELSLKKEDIVDMAKNIEKQYLTLAEMIKQRSHQTLFLNEGLEKYSLKDFISAETLNKIAVALHGIIVNMEDIKVSISKINLEYPVIAEKYSKYLELENVENPEEDMDLLAAELIDAMQPYLKITTDTSNKIDVLTETYTTEVQIKIETVLNTLAKANIFLDKLALAEEEIKNNLEENEDGTTK